MAGVNNNLIPLTERSPEEAYEIRRKGAMTVNERRLRRKTFAEDFKDALCAPGVQEEIVMGMLKKAQKDPRAFALILETIGENGAAKVEMSTVESARKDAWDALREMEEEASEERGSEEQGGTPF